MSDSNSDEEYEDNPEYYLHTYLTSDRTLYYRPEVTCGDSTFGPEVVVVMVLNVASAWTRSNVRIEIVLWVIQTRMAEPGAGFDSKGLGLRAQKKLLGKMSSKKIAKQFIDDDTSCVLDHAYKIMKEHAQNKKDAEKILKYIIKTIIKVGILYRNDQFNADELQLAETFKSKFRSLSMTVCSFHEVEFTFDRNFLRSSIEECRQLLQDLIARHLTDKSKSRVDTVFDFFTSQELMDILFVPDGKYREHMDIIVTRMHKMMDDGNL